MDESTPTLRGSCLCGGIHFEISGPYSPIGKCHCSKCRKVSGTGSNAVFHTAAGSLHWKAGEDLVRKFQFQDGWGSTFCGTCGSPLPHLSSNNKIYFVPAGLLDDDPGVNVELHIYVGSKASWDEISSDARQFEEAGPELQKKS
jgi:hypothetical protein